MEQTSQPRYLAAVAGVCVYQGLQVRRRRRKRISRGERVPLPAPSGPSQRWSMDFMADTLADGRGFHTCDRQRQRP